VRYVGCGDGSGYSSSGMLSEAFAWSFPQNEGGGGALNSRAGGKAAAVLRSPPLVGTGFSSSVPRCFGTGLQVDKYPCCDYNFSIPMDFGKAHIYGLPTTYRVVLSRGVRAIGPVLERGREA